MTGIAVFLDTSSVSVANGSVQINGININLLGGIITRTNVLCKDENITIIFSEAYE